MKASANHVETTAPAAVLASSDKMADDLDIGLLEESLAKTPWERMPANDDALRFAELLRAAVEKRNAEPQRTDPH